jgi:molybdopterin-guanine dinucleotide biosynthesis protein B
MRILHFAGPSDSGKTRLIEALLPRLQVAEVIKWSHHPLSEDLPGTDTARLGHWGQHTLLATSSGVLWRRRFGTRDPVYQLVADVLDDDALVIVEGDKRSRQPKIWLGSHLPEPDVAVSLWIGGGPLPPPRSEISWWPAETPLTETDVARTADRLAESWEAWTYRWPRRPLV